MHRGKSLSTIRYALEEIFSTLNVANWKPTLEPSHEHRWVYDQILERILYAGVEYEELERKLRERPNNPWPKTIGIDEHSFRRGKLGCDFSMFLVDYPNKKFFDLGEGKTAEGVKHTFAHVPGRERVQNVVLDMSDPFKKFAKEMFPQAKIMADHFHVIRLLNPMINKARTEIAGDKRSNSVRKLFLMNGKRLQYFERRALQTWLELHPK